MPNPLRITTRTPIDFDLCLKRDEFIWDKPVWVVTLEDDTEIWQDDERPGAREPSAWIRLRKYVNVMGIRIKKFQLRFRSNIITLPAAKLYYYTRGILGSTGSDTCTHYACIGYTNTDKVDVTWYRVPELSPEKTVTKSIYELNGPEIIEGSYDGEEAD
jgi:hypothetical protein